jgi:hypothetical protein
MLLYGCVLTVFLEFELDDRISALICQDHLLCAPEAKILKNTKMCKDLMLTLYVFARTLQQR